MTTKRKPQFNVRISPELKKEIVALAEKNKRPINAEINAALEAWVEICNKYENEFKERYIFTNVDDNYSKSKKYDDNNKSYILTIFNNSIEEAKEDIKKDILKEFKEKWIEFLIEQTSKEQLKKIIEMGEKK
ncbi:TPA: Arc family DNA-binding protein [Proteus mirabilis]|uniref:Arc family DNA-binding protein n=1 Tax=Proteus mirabilis TaxID=584 RepID=UPI001FF3253B|nr:Arc family DNA-binding protein [Proteus mirabilis]MCJ8514935.1 Arc family DNA-binding protein [Proteus mirabilis]